MKGMRKLMAGFSLVEVALVLAIGGFLLTTITLATRSYMKLTRITATRSRLSDVQNAITEYFHVNGKLPCPAPLNALPDTVAFGLEINKDCPAAAVVVNESFGGTGVDGLKVRIGAVPVRSLNLPDIDAMDAWNNRIIYAVTENLASTTVPYNPLNGDISIIDSAGNNFENPAGSMQYVVISHGENRNGAYPAMGNAGAALACTVGTLESLNCTFPPAAPVRFRQTLNTGTEVGVNTFDDYVVYAKILPDGVVPAKTVSVFNLAVCPAGWMAPPPLALAALPAAGILGAGLIYCEKQ